MKIHNLAFCFLLLFSSACNQSAKFRAASLPDAQLKINSNKPETESFIFQSSDRGATWQEISEGLPGKLRAWYFANEKGIYVAAGNGLYHSKPGSAAPIWEKKTFPGEQYGITAGSAGLIAFDFNGKFLQNIYGTDTWAPKFAHFKEKGIRTIFETAAGTVFVGCNYGLFKSTDDGKSWKQVYTGGHVDKLVELNGVLLGTSHLGILRSTDDGENWEYVIREGGFGLTIEPIKGGVAAIIFSKMSQSMRIVTSYNGGTIWEPIDAGLPAYRGMSSIAQVDNDFFCSHPAGIYKSSDKGKTWKLILPAVKDKRFSLYVSGNVVYALATKPGC